MSWLFWLFDEKELKQADLIVIGAGASGLMASITAADLGLSVIVLESMPLPARKLGISGKGRGNLTNMAPLQEFLRHFNNPRFLKASFAHFFNKELIDFFAREGLKTAEERGKRVFVASGRATDASRCLHKAAVKRGVKLLLNTKAKSLIIKNKTCVGVLAETGEQLFSCCVLLASGGKSYPKTGSTGHGYEMAREAGHAITKLLPALTALKPKISFLPDLNGLTLKNVYVSLIINGKKECGEMGEMQFIGGFLGGPIVITLSKKAVNAISLGQRAELLFDLKPALSYEKLDARILRDIALSPKGRLISLLGALMPQALARYFLKTSGLSSDISNSELNKAQRRLIISFLKELRFEVNGSAGFNQAITTSGGVDCAEINPNTLESKLIKNLYFAGEVIDIDADTGGFNLQAAFSTGYLAAVSIKKAIK